MRLFSTRNRPPHLGPFPLERLARAAAPARLNETPAMAPLPPAPEGSLAGTLGLFLAMLDAIRDGKPAPNRSVFPDDPGERARHLKAAGYYFDATQAGICTLPRESLLETPLRNRELDKLATDLQTAQPKTLASGIDVIMADVREAAATKPSPVNHHTHAIVFLIEHPREPDPQEPGGKWIAGATAHRSAFRIAETAVVVANYLRILGVEARAHTATSSDVDLNKLAVAAGLCEIVETGEARVVSNPYVGSAFSLAAITTTLELECDQPLAPRGFAENMRSHGLAWQLGKGSQRSAANAQPYAKRRFVDGAYPFENIKRVDQTTTLIDEPRIPRVPKRTDMFARALFGDMGKQMQDAAKNGMYVLKNPLGYCCRRALAAFILLQDGDKAPQIADSARDPVANSENVKAALYFLGCDAVGVSRCPDWVYYSHDASGNEIKPYHNNAISILIDQGQETMDGCSGDDWISGCQSMRAYLRGSILGGVVAEQIRRLGYSARVHSAVDGEVLQPPLLLLSGLGEMSRIGEVILNPYLGPRLKSTVVTTDMPMAHDKPIDFGMQNFCNNCNKCARECPAGAITAGPKLMFNGYEIWKSDSERCARYRLTNTAGSMCGRCMKTCPWNLEGLFKEAPFRWAAMKIPSAARWLAELDDKVGNGAVNPVKKWWWDLDIRPDGSYAPASQVNARELQPDLKLKYEDQTLAVYPANLAPPPWPFPSPIDREKGIAAYKAMLTSDEHKARLARGETQDLAPKYELPKGEAPVLPVKLARVETMTSDITKYEFAALDGAPLPAVEAGAHIDVVVAPEFFRQYSLSGDPADRSKYQIAVLREDNGRGGSKLMHRIFREGRKVFISRPVNHFPLDESATRTLLFGGGIGVTPMIAMAHRLHALGRDFELHYSCKNRAVAGFLDDLANAPWRDRVVLHFSDEGTRANLDALLGAYREGWHVYTCGPDRFMTSVIETAQRHGWAEDAIHREYFSVPEQPEYENFPFTLHLAGSGKSFEIPADKSITDVLTENGVHVDLKCSDGICGVCKAKIVSGEVEHRDFVLPAREKATHIILCSSRAKQAGGELTVELPPAGAA